MQPIADVHPGSIALMPYAFCDPDNPVIRYNQKGQWWGESDEGVIASIQLAHQRGLSVMLKPHLWISHGTYTAALHYIQKKSGSYGKIVTVNTCCILRTLPTA